MSNKPWTNKQYKQFGELPSGWLQPGMVISFQRKKYARKNNEWIDDGYDIEETALVGDLNDGNGACDDCHFFNNDDLILSYYQIDLKLNLK